MPTCVGLGSPVLELSQCVRRVFREDWHRITSDVLISLANLWRDQLPWPLRLGWWDDTCCRLLDGAGDGVASVEGEAINRALDVNGNGRTLTVWLQRRAPIGGAFILLSRDATASYYSRYFELAKAADAHGHAPGLRAVASLQVQRLGAIRQ